MNNNTSYLSGLLATFLVMAFTLSYFFIHLPGSASYLANSLAMSGQM